MLCIIYACLKISNEIGFTEEENHISLYILLNPLMFKFYFNSIIFY